MKKIFFLLLLTFNILLAVTLSPKNTYQINQPISIEFKDFTNHNKDWIAIYPAGSSNAWKNVKQWRWTDNKTNGNLNFNPLPEGNYEVRGFYNNTYDPEATSPFNVTAQGEAQPALSTKEVYNTNEAISIEFKDFTNHNKDWIAIYPAGSSNAWKNVKQWRWTDNKTNGNLNFNPLPLGNYELRGFYNNSFKSEAAHKFKVTGNVIQTPLTKVHNLIKRGNSHYVVVGDSTRASFGASLIFTNIRNAFQKYNLKVSLNAQGGYSVSQFLNPALNQYPHYKKVINLIQGNGNTSIVDISLGVNDISRNTSSKELERLIKKAIRLIKDAKPKTTFLLTSPNAFLNNKTNTEKTINAYRNLSNELNIPLINFHDNIYSNYTRTQQQALYRDGIHYSKHGTEVQANYIVNQLKP